MTSCFIRWYFYHQIPGGSRLSFVPGGSILFLFCLLFLIFPAIARTQDSTAVPLAENELVDSLWIVDTVVVKGNEHTKDYVVRREMTLHPGSRITKSALSYDQSRVYSLRLFNQVEMRVIPTTPGYATLLVEVSERWYIFPFPIVGLRDRDWKKVFLGAGILHSNFLGRNERLYAALVLGYDPAMTLSYRNPFLDADGTEFLEADVSLNIVENKSVLAEGTGSNYDERHASFGLTLGKRIGIEHTLWISGGYQFIEVSDNMPGRTISPDGKDRFPILSVGYAYDTRDLGEYPSDGTYLAGTITKFGVPSYPLDYIRYAFDVKKYFSLPASFVFAGRVYGDMAAGGTVPPYNHDYFGYGNRIRGHFKEVYEGEQLVGASFELHHTIIATSYFKVGALPAQFSVWRFGVVAALFADEGTVWFRPAPFSSNRFIKGYGAGLHFMLPYSFILRTEYALNEVRRGEFIIDVGNSL
jgi:outer membrane protein assembly factor BamA